MNWLDPGRGSGPEDRPPPMGPASWTQRGVGALILTPPSWGVLGVFYCSIRAETVQTLPPQQARKACPRTRRDGRCWGQSGLTQRPPAPGSTSSWAAATCNK